MYLENRFYNLVMIQSINTSSSLYSFSSNLKKRKYILRVKSLYPTYFSLVSVSISGLTTGATC